MRSLRNILFHGLGVPNTVVVIADGAVGGKDTAEGGIEQRLLRPSLLIQIQATGLSLRTGIVLKKECVNFRVQMVYAISGEYKFLFRNGQAVQTYDPRGYDPKPKKNSSRRSSVEVKQRYGKHSGLHGLIAFVGVLIIAAACTLSALKANDVFGTRREPEIPGVEEAPPTEYFPLG